MFPPWVSISFFTFRESVKTCGFHEIQLPRRWASEDRPEFWRGGPHTLGWGVGDPCGRRHIFPNSSGGKGGKAGLPFLPSLGHPASSSRVSCSGKVRKSSGLLPKETVAFFRSSAVSRETWERSSFGSLVTVPSRGGLSPSSHATNGKDDEKRFLFIENTHPPKYLL